MTLTLPADQAERAKAQAQDAARRRERSNRPHGATALVELTAFPKSGALLIEDVSALAVAEKWDVKELYAEAGRLDEVFRAITTHDAARARESARMKRVWPIFKREFASYFATPLAYVFIVIFLFAMGAFTFYIGHFYENGVADLTVFFGYHPWLYLFLVPAIAMRLWAEERRSGTMELLLTLPVPLWATVLGKYLAAWAFAGVALALTFPIWITVNYLGHPDNGVILACYIGSFLMAGGYLAIGACISAATNNQVIAFVVSVVVCFLFTISGAPLVLDFFQRLGAAGAGRTRCRPSASSPISRPSPRA